MSQLDREADVVRIASELRLDTASPVGAIVGFCRQRLDCIFDERSGSIVSLAELQAAVCRQLRLVFEGVYTDEDLDRVVKKYVAMREFGFAALRGDLDPSTFATLLERRHVDGSAPDRYVAVIDCRGTEKLARRYFTRWHEIAHILTLTRQLELPFHRSTSDHSPIERLMDVVAGEIGFYSPLVTPALFDELNASTYLTFAGVERVRDNVCSEASFQATLNACVGRARHAVVLLEAAMGYKKAEVAELRSKQMTFRPVELPKPQLRVLSSVRNDAARHGSIRIDKNMRVPAASLVGKHFCDNQTNAAAADRSGKESLSIWRHSDGKAVGLIDVCVQSRRVGDRMLALIQPVVQQPIERASATKT